MPGTAQTPDEGLAAAYAAAGRFDRAINAARSAADLAIRAGSFDLVAEIRQRLALYEQQTAYVAVPRE